MNNSSLHSTLLKDETSPWSYWQLNWAILIFVDNMFRVCALILANNKRLIMRWLEIVCNGADESTLCLPPNPEVLSSSSLVLFVFSLIYIRFESYRRFLIFHLIINTVTTPTILGFGLTNSSLCWWFMTSWTDAHMYRFYVMTLTRILLRCCDGWRDSSIISDHRKISVYTRNSFHDQYDKLSSQIITNTMIIS